MIRGVGVDIVGTGRFKAAMDKWGRRFLDRVFTGREIAHCLTKARPHVSLAVRFAAKEAFIKASGLSGITFRDIEVANRKDGSPLIKKEGRLALALASAGIADIHLSLSHEEEYAVAMVVAEGAPAPDEGR